MTSPRRARSLATSATKWSPISRKRSTAFARRSPGCGARSRQLLRGGDTAEPSDEPARWSCRRRGRRARSWCGQVVEGATPSRTTICRPGWKRSVGRLGLAAPSGRPAPRRHASRCARHPGEGCTRMARRGRRWPRPGWRRRGGAVARPRRPRRGSPGGDRVDRSDPACPPTPSEPTGERRGPVATGADGQSGDLRARSGDAGDGGSDRRRQWPGDHVCGDHRSRRSHRSTRASSGWSCRPRH